MSIKNLTEQLNKLVEMIELNTINELDYETIGAAHSAREQALRDAERNFTKNSKLYNNKVIQWVKEGLETEDLPRPNQVVEPNFFVWVVGNFIIAFNQRENIIPGYRLGFGPGNDDGISVYKEDSSSNKPMYEIIWYRGTAYLELCTYDEQETIQKVPFSPKLPEDENDYQGYLNFINEAIEAIKQFEL